jgi:CPA1 family monovalent cation:H+ antiporter
MVVRLAFTFTATFIIRAVDRRPYQRTLRAPTRALLMNAFAGYRGAVSLAAALAIPLTVADGDAFPMRNLIVFVTAVVIVLTLGVQGPLFPLLVRWAHLPADSTATEERRLAQIESSRAALEALPNLAAQLGIDDDVRDRIIRETEHHLAALEVDGDTEDGVETARMKEQYTQLRLASMHVKRETVLRLRDERRIDDTVVRDLGAQLDLEELRLTGREAE